MENFTKRLKYIRTSRNLAQRQVAAAIDVGETIYQRYESGKGKPSFENLWALADFFDISVDYLMGRSDNPKMN